MDKVGRAESIWQEWSQPGDGFLDKYFSVGSMWRTRIGGWGQGVGWHYSP